MHKEVEKLNVVICITYNEAKKKKRVIRPVSTLDYNIFHALLIVSTVNL